MLRRHAFLLPSLLVLSGAPVSAEILERIIVKVNGEIITQTEFQARQLAAAQVAREGMTLEDLKRNIERSIVRRQILSRDIEGKITVSDSEGRAEYDKRIADFTKPATVSLLEILVKDEGGADP